MTKIISISDKVCKELSNVIKKKSLLGFAGLLSDEESNKIKKEIKKIRKSRRF